MKNILKHIQRWNKPGENAIISHSAMRYPHMTGGEGI